MDSLKSMPKDTTNPRAKETEMSKSGKLFLVDGHSFCYRAYYAIRNLSNSKGEPTNAIYGFITMLRKLIQDYGPDHLAICFDHAKPTFRHEKYKDYKANRSPMPEDLCQQIEPIKDFCKAFRFAMFEMPGYEADDVIGTLARRAEKIGYEVFIITGDKDAMQLVNERVRILNPHKDGTVYDVAAVKKKFDGLGPDQVIDVMALMGDSSDNIPGVHGIGEKTAVKLIQEFGSVENLMNHLEKIKSKKQQEMLAGGRDDALLSKDLARIDTEVDFDVDWDSLELRPPDEEHLINLVKRYEFRALLKELPPVTAPAARRQDEKRCYHTIQTEEELAKFVKELSGIKEFSFDTETTSSDPMRACLVGMSFSWKNSCAHYIPVSSCDHQGKGIPVEKVLAAVKPLLEDSSYRKAGQNVKYDYIVMKRHGVELKGVFFDTMIASYLINPVKFTHNLDDISLEYLGMRKIPTQSLLGTGKNQVTMDTVALEHVSEYACEDVDCVYQLVPILGAKIRENNLWKLFEEVEMPLSLVLAEMEMNGVYLDTKLLEELSSKAADDLQELTWKICEEAGEEFNINSTKQLADVFFVKKKFPVIKKTKTGFSTDVSVLEKLAEDYELPRMILEYREKSKLKSTYLDALPKMIHPDTGVVHTSYNQATTVTGRLSSTDPNLQNIPIKTEAGRMIRKAFIPRPRERALGSILSADYSQIELRILAHFSGDESLMRAFREERDIHNFTATLLYGLGEKEITREMRNVAKTINFSIIYGKTAYGLSQDLGISVGEADEFIKNYFSRYSGVRDYLESQKEKARREGYLTTLLGRRAYFPDINSKNAQLRQFAERAAVNAPIQGSAADLIKLAMIRIQDRLKKETFESLMIMQVHDELVFDGPEKEMAELKELVRDGMETAHTLNVPLVADVYIGQSWYKN